MRIVVLAAALGVSAVTAPAWAQTSAAAEPMTIVFPDQGPSGMTDLPMGAHRIPDSRVIISGHQKGGLIGPMFGVLGILAQSAANADAGRGAVGGTQDGLRFDVAAKAVELAGTIVAGDAYRQKYTLSPNAGGGTLSVVPYVVITFVNETDVRPYVVLKTTLSGGPANAGSATAARRMIKYFCCEGAPLPLAGDTGLSANGGERLKTMLTAQLETALHVMLLDRSQAYARDGQPKIAIEGSLPFVRNSIKVKGYNLGRYNDYSLFEIRGGNVFAGVHIAEPSSMKIEGAN